MSRFETSMKAVCMALFEAVSKYEEAWRADICTRSTEDIQGIIDDIVGLRVKSMTLRVNILKDYTRWCIKNNISGATDGMLQIHELGLSKVATRTVANPLHLQRYLNSIFDPEEKQSVDCTYRCYLWLAFGGMTEDDIMLVRSENVDFTDMVVQFSNRKYPIYREALTAFKICATSATLNYVNPKGKTIIYNRVDGDLLLRGYKALPSYKTIRSELSHHSHDAIESGKTTQSISYYRAWLSGIFYRMFEWECMGNQVDFMSTAGEYMKGRVFKLDSGRNTLEAKQRQIAKDYLNDYERWKKVYHPNLI